MHPLDYLTVLSKKFPTAWGLINQFRVNKEEPQWPCWCFLPMDAWYAIVAREYNSSQLSNEQIKEASYLAAIGTWRYTQGIYHFEQTLYERLLDDIAINNLIFSHLQFPEWSSYVVTPSLTWNNHPLHGFWCHFEWDKKTSLNELRIVLNTHRLITLSFLIEDGILKNSTQKDVFNISFSSSNNMFSLYIIFRMAHCLCSKDIKIYNEFGRHPQNPQPKIYKGSLRLFPVQSPTNWNIFKNE